LDPARNPPGAGTEAGDYLKYAPLLWADKNAAIGKIVADRGPLWERLMRPFLLAALNTEPEESSAALAGQVLRETLAKGWAPLPAPHRAHRPWRLLCRSSPWSISRPRARRCN
jgi:hypothetical protein